jgi:hypothetical protein
LKPVAELTAAAVSESAFSKVTLLRLIRILATLGARLPLSLQIPTLMVESRG